MKRRKASTKMTTVVHAGWMTKSPPERKLNAPFKIFRSQWKKRYFVLRKPSGSLPDQYELHYYKDQRCLSKKGSIDLEQCEQIIEALDSDIFPNLLAIKTYYKNKVRTYYLAADTEQEMNTWVQWLCHVCGLKPEDQPTDLPEPKPSQSQATGISPSTGLGASPGITNGTSASPPRSNQTTVTSAKGPSAMPVSSQAPISTQPLARTGSDNSISYIPLENCTTGQPQPVDRRESVESVPDYTAPAPPQKRHGNQTNGITASDDDVFVPGLYDHPPRPIEVPSRDTSSELYKVPPVRPAQGNQLAVDDDGRDSSYDVPPPRSRSPRSSTGAHTDSSLASGGTGRGSEGRAVTPTECYDYPPPRRDSGNSSDSEIPPERPPKPSHLQSPYQNLPPAGKVIPEADLMSTVPAPPRAHINRQNTGYDIPRSHIRTPRHQQQSLSFVTPPPRTVPTASTHNYLNTQNRPGSGELHLAPKGEDGSDLAEGGGGPPAIPPPRLGSAGEPQDGRSASPSLYQSPPPSSASSSSSGAPARPPARTVGQPPTVSPRSHDGNAAANQVTDDSGASIFSTQRTRSFKRHHNVNSNSPKQGRKANTLPVPLPARPQRPKDISTSDDEDDADKEEETHHPLSLLHSVPAPSVDNERELKYIDLALPEVSPEPARTSHGHGHIHSHSHSHADRSKESATEYREIDFVKTQALNEAKRVKEKERKNDDHN